jgi:hypothetical protein
MSMAVYALLFERNEGPASTFVGLAPSRRVIIMLIADLLRLVPSEEVADAYPLAM